MIHSATKYLAGHGDVLGGLVISDAENFETLNTLARGLWARIWVRSKRI